MELEAAKEDVVAVLVAAPAPLDGLTGGVVVAVVVVDEVAAVVDAP